MPERIGITVRIAPELHEQLRILAFHSRLPIGSAAAQIVVEYLQNNPPEAVALSLQAGHQKERSRRALNRSKKKKKR